MRGSLAKKLRKETAFHPSDERSYEYRKNNLSQLKNTENSPRAKYQKLKKEYKWN